MQKTGTATPQFGAVVAAYQSLFALGRERASQLVVTHGGAAVVDLCWSRDAKAAPMAPADAAMIFSCGKVVESLAVAMLADRGLLAYERPVAAYWPAFGARYSEATTVAQLMGHRGRVARIVEPFADGEAAREVFESAERLEAWLFRAVPQDDARLVPDGQSMYHPVTRGIFVDLLVLHATGLRLAAFVQTEIFDRVGADAMSIGAPTRARFAAAARCEDMNRAGLWFDLFRLAFAPLINALSAGGEAHRMRYFTGPEVAANRQIMRNPKVRQAFSILKDMPMRPHQLTRDYAFAGLPLSSGCTMGSAQSMGRILRELCLEGDNAFLSAAGMAAALAPEAPAFDVLMQQELCFTRCGWAKDYIGPGWFGWWGAGGSIMAFHPAKQLSLSYVPTKLEARSYCANALRLKDAAEACAE